MCLRDRVFGRERERETWLSVCLRDRVFGREREREGERERERHG